MLVLYCSCTISTRLTLLYFSSSTSLIGMSHFGPISTSCNCILQSEMADSDWGCKCHGCDNCFFSREYPDRKCVQNIGKGDWHNPGSPRCKHCRDFEKEERRQQAQQSASSSQAPLSESVLRAVIEELQTRVDTLEAKVSRLFDILDEDEDFLMVK